MEVAEFHGRVMASRLHIITVGKPHPNDARSVDQAVQRTVLYLEHLEQCWSRFIGSSDVCRINQLGPGGGTIDVDPATLTLLATMVDGYRSTAGRFDPTVLRAMISEGYGASLVEPTKFSAVGAEPVLPPSLEDLVLDPTANTVTVPPGLVVDPGGIGKGLAADLAVAELIDDGLAGALVEIGGDLAAAGVPVDEAGWLVDVERPDPDDGLLCSLAISGGGVATSSVASRRWTHGGVERHHQIDPDTGTCSTTDLTAVTVIARAGWLAEVHATAALSLGSGRAIDYLDGHGLSGIAVALTPTGERVRTTRDLAVIDFHTPADLRCEVS